MPGVGWESESWELVLGQNDNLRLLVSGVGCESEAEWDFETNEMLKYNNFCCVQGMQESQSFSYKII